ncbi:MAG: lipopolysaccharide biosynthesis protein RfbH, partial [Elusimicrobiota bacterium]
ACLDSFKPDVVFMALNTSGGVDACEEAPALADAVIVRGTKNVLAAAARHKSKVIFYSSDYVFDGKSGPYSEEDKPNPVNAYGRAKLTAERLVSAYPHGHLIIRTTAVYSWQRGSKNFAMQVFERLGAGRRLKVPKDQLCNPTLAEQLAESSLRLVLAEAEGIYNVVGSTRTDRSELAKGIAKALAFDPALIQPIATSKLSQKAARPLNAGLKTDKLEKLLGTRPLDLGQSLKRLGRAWRSDTHIKPPRRAAAGRASRLKQDILKRVREFHKVGHAKQRFIPGKTRIQYSGRVFGPEELVNLVDASLDFWLTLGPYGDLFEKKMRRHLGCRDFVFVNSGSTANLTAVMALMSKSIENPLKPGDEVITPAVTFPTTAAPLVHGGLVPVFVDCELGTYNIDPKLVDAAVSKKTRAIMIPHTLGNPCGLDVICEIAKRRGLYLIEDACDALGSTFDGRVVGTFGDLGTASFFPAHHITTGEGGGVIVNRARLVRTVRSVRDWGRDCWCAPGETNSCGKRFGWQLGGLPRGYDHKYTYSNIGYNFKPTDLQAAIGAAQADRLDEFNKKRRENFQSLAEGLAGYADRLILPKCDERADPAWFALPLTVQGGVERSALVRHLESANIETREIFGGNILQQPGYQDIPHRVHGNLKNSDRVMRDSFFIGVYPGLTEEMIHYVLKTFKAFFARGSRG